MHNNLSNLYIYIKWFYQQTKYRNYYYNHYFATYEKEISFRGKLISLYLNILQYPEILSLHYWIGIGNERKAAGTRLNKIDISQNNGWSWSNIAKRIYQVLRNDEKLKRAQIPTRWLTLEIMHLIKENFEIKE